MNWRSICLYFRSRLEKKEELRGQKLLESSGKKFNMELAVFYCFQQTEGIGPILKAIEDSGTVETKKVALPCSGKVEVAHLTKALESGAEAVAIFGCPEGDCQYIVGSRRAKGRIGYAQRILEGIGLQGERVRRFVLTRDPDADERKSVLEWIDRIRALPREGNGPELRGME